VKFNSIRFKVSALLTGILGVVLVAYSSFLYYSLSASLYGELKNDLERKSRAVSSVLT